MTFVVPDAEQQEVPVEPEENEAERLARAQEQIVGSTPTIPPIPNLSFDLEQGYWTGREWESRVTLRELNGADEEQLSKAQTTQDLFDTAVALSVESIGAVDFTAPGIAERKAMLSRLLLGEREQIALQSARVTFGDEKDIQFTCPQDSTEFEATILISEIPIKKMSSPGSMGYNFTTKGGDEIVYRLVTGDDSENMRSRKGSSVGENNTFLLAEVIRTVNGKPLVDPAAYCRSLSMSDRRKLIEALDAEQPYPDMQFINRCTTCGTEVMIALTWADLFRP